jgi:hypothetical protein
VTASPADSETVAKARPGRVALFFGESRPRQPEETRRGPTARWIFGDTSSGWGGTGTQVAPLPLSGQFSRFVGELWKSPIAEGE